MRNLSEITLKTEKRERARKLIPTKWNLRIESTVRGKCVFQMIKSQSIPSHRGCEVWKWALAVWCPIEQQSKIYTFRNEGKVFRLRPYSKPHTAGLCGEPTSGGSRGRFNFNLSQQTAKVVNRFGKKNSNTPLIIDDDEFLFFLLLFSPDNMIKKSRLISIKSRVCVCVWVVQMNFENS